MTMRMFCMTEKLLPCSAYMSRLLLRHLVGILLTFLSPGRLPSIHQFPPLIYELCAFVLSCPKLLAMPCASSRMFRPCCLFLLLDCFEVLINFGLQKTPLFACFLIPLILCPPVPAFLIRPL